jgi:hypothetical protein
MSKGLRLAVKASVKLTKKNRSVDGAVLEKNSKQKVTNQIGVKSKLTFQPPFPF